MNNSRVKCVVQILVIDSIYLNYLELMFCLMNIKGNAILIFNILNYSMIYNFINYFFIMCLVKCIRNYQIVVTGRLYGIREEKFHEYGILHYGLSVNVQLIS